MADARRIWLKSADGGIVASMDVTDIPHQNTLSPLFLELVTRCDLGEWHADWKREVPCWGPGLGPAQ